MKKTKILYIFLFLVYIGVLGIFLIKFKNVQNFDQKIVLSHEIKKVLECLMPDIYHARGGSFKDLPADGQWHQRIAFDTAQGALEYSIKDGHLFRIDKGNELLIADNISGLRIRRQQSSPDLLEVQIEARKNISLVSNLKIRIPQ